MAIVVRTTRWPVALAAGVLLMAPPTQAALLPGDPSLLPVCRVDTSRPLVALTFDDGPFPAETATARTLLRRHGARATFFLVGRRAFTWPGVVAALRRDGQEIANHTWSHSVPSGLGAHRTRAEIEHAATALPGHERLFRPPQGRIDVDGLRAARDAGLVTVVWSLAVERHTPGRAPGEAARAVLAGSAGARSSSPTSVAPGRSPRST